jgi:choloylglycine hydrolase
VLPLKIQREGPTKEHPIRWTSRCGSVVTAALEATTPDTMNENGLVATLLYLA